MSRLRVGLCASSKCRKRADAWRKLRACLREEVELRAVGCLDHCKGPAVKVEAHGKRRVYGKIRSKSERRALLSYVLTGKESKALKKLRS